MSALSSGAGLAYLNSTLPLNGVLFGLANSTSINFSPPFGVGTILTSLGIGAVPQFQTIDFVLNSINGFPSIPTYDGGLQVLVSNGGVAQLIDVDTCSDMLVGLAKTAVPIDTATAMRIANLEKRITQLEALIKEKLGG